MQRADQRKFHYIYKITRDDGKYYIGLHSTDNLEDGYFGSGQLLWKSIRKHGKEQHTKEILEFLPSRLELKTRERELVNESALADPLCLNVCLGGGESPMMIEAVRAKVGARQKEIWSNMSVEEITRRASIGGRAHAAKLKSDPEYAASYHAKQSAKRFTLTDEQKAKISAGNTGKNRSDDVKKHLSAVALERPKEACVHCGTKATTQNLAKWHNDKCKLKPQE